MRKVQKYFWTYLDRNLPFRTVLSRMCEHFDWVYLACSHIFLIKHVWTWAAPLKHTNTHTVDGIAKTFPQWGGRLGGVCTGSEMRLDREHGAPSKTWLGFNRLHMSGYITGPSPEITSSPACRTPSIQAGWKVWSPSRKSPSELTYKSFTPLTSRSGHEEVGNQPAAVWRSVNERFYSRLAILSGLSNKKRGKTGVVHTVIWCSLFRCQSQTTIILLG